MTLGMKQVKGARKGLTFKALVALPFCIVLILQGVMSAAILSGSRVFVQMDDAAYDLFSERVASRASYLEGDMVLRWSDFGSTPDVVADRVDEVLAERGASVSDIVPGSDVALSIIDAMADDLVSFIRHNEVSGAYFVLANGGAEGEAADARTALYIRDSNPKVNAEGGSDLMVASCPISVGRTMEIALDSQWSATFPLAAEGNQRSAFYYEPLRAAQKHPDAETSDLGYWGRPVDLGWAGTPSVTYSVPIRTASGELCGVLGVEIRLDRIESFFSVSRPERARRRLVPAHNRASRRLRAQRRRGTLCRTNRARTKCWLQAGRRKACTSKTAPSRLFWTTRLAW